MRTDEWGKTKRAWREKNCRLNDRVETDAGEPHEHAIPGVSHSYDNSERTVTRYVCFAELEIRQRQQVKIPIR